MQNEEKEVKKIEIGIRVDVIVSLVFIFLIALAISWVMKETGAPFWANISLVWITTILLLMDRKLDTVYNFVKIVEHGVKHGHMKPVAISDKQREILEKELQKVVDEDEEAEQEKL